ncbi:hypothetical protein ABEB36_011704 [Hypothenemus hampei]|uniref:Putative nuclease HARBI1 n=1 Tax=Hypothenemus hampei TaxID=57062 RepID=A0ABD1E8Q3_HYPHA
MSDHLSSSDEDMEEMLDLIEVPKSIAYFEEIVPQFSDELYIQHFRLTREMSEDLANRFADSEYYTWQEGDSEKVTPLKYIVVFLWFAANEATSFREVSDRFHITKSTLFKIVRRVTFFLSNLSPEIIKWPEDLEKLEIEEHFRHRDFPGVIGIIDGTHIRIDKPKEDPDSYLNRKHFYSIQAQVVCDHKRRIRDIFVGYPGSVHDSRVLRTSPLHETLPEKCGDLYVLGDSGYPCLKNLLTPFKDNGHLTRRQINYNYVHSRNRYIIEHCFGIMKQKFRQLYHLKIKDIELIVHFIRACAVLHNLSLDVTFVADEEIVPENIIVLNEDDYPDRDDRNGVAIREAIMNNLRLV